MAGICERLREFLDEHGAEYEVIHHLSDYRAWDTARHTATPPAEFAKSVFVSIDGADAMVVLPASRYVSSKAVRESLGADEVILVTEQASRQLCPDCEIGAAPPFGNLYDVPVYVSCTLARHEQITFNAGSHTAAIRMSFETYAKLVSPRVIAICADE